MNRPQDEDLMLKNAAWLVKRAEGAVAALRRNPRSPRLRAEAKAIISRLCLVERPELVTIIRGY